MEDSSPVAVKLAFLSYVETHEPGVGRGALLVTDEATRPLEFRCTTPIQPNGLQRVLYGRTLRSYIMADLVGAPLLAAVQEMPRVILVTDALFLRLRPKIGIAMVCLRRQGEQISTILDEDAGLAASEPALLSCASGHFRPLTLTGPQGSGSELETAIEILRPVFSGADLLEPFERIEKVVAELDKQEGGSVERPKAKQAGGA